MTRLALTAIATLAAATTASAQMTDPSSSWSGPYAGIHAGYGFDGGKTISDQGATANNFTALAAGIRPYRIGENREGFVGGGQLGMNFQRGPFVFGAEGDFSYMRSRGTATIRGAGVVGTALPGRRTLVKSRLDWLSSARLRAGYAPSESGLIYVTGGYAVGKIKGRAEFDGDSDATVNYAGRHAYTAQGWIAGGGLEFRPFGAGSKVSFGAEATYYDLGKSSIYALQTSTQPGFYRLGVTTQGYNGVLKMNYGF